MKKLMLMLALVLMAGMAQAILLEHYKFTATDYGKPQYESTYVNTSWFQRESTGASSFTTNLTRTSVDGTFTALGASAAGNTQQNAVDGFWSSLGNMGWGPSANQGTQPTTPRYGYLTMTVQNLGAGETLNLTSVDFDWNIFNVRNNAEYYTRVFADVNGSTANFNNGTSLWKTFIGNPATGAGTGWNTENVDVSSVTRLQGLENGDVVEFRVYASSLGDNRGDYLYDDFKINGSVVPEPATLGLLGIGGLLALLVRRYRAI